jgi:hypothetical protein
MAQSVQDQVAQDRLDQFGLGKSDGCHLEPGGAGRENPVTRVMPAKATRRSMPPISRMAYRRFGVQPALLILCDHLLLDSSPEDSDTDADAIQKYAMSSAMARRMPSTPRRARAVRRPRPDEASIPHAHNPADQFGR